MQSSHHHRGLPARIRHMGGALDLGVWRSTQRLAGNSRWLFGVFSDGIQLELLRLEDFARRQGDYRETLQQPSTLQDSEIAERPSGAYARQDAAAARARDAA
ncbi:MAG: hypothetical protein R3B89_30585 [Polyangiaceae bacterium]